MDLSLHRINWEYINEYFSNKAPEKLLKSLLFDTIIELSDSNGFEMILVYWNFVKLVMIRSTYYLNYYRSWDWTLISEISNSKIDSSGCSVIYI